jgi:hypothetical protein
MDLLGRVVLAEEYHLLQTLREVLRCVIFASSEPGTCLRWLSDRACEDVSRPGRFEDVQKSAATCGVACGTSILRGRTSPPASGAGTPALIHPCRDLPTALQSLSAKAGTSAAVRWLRTTHLSWGTAVPDAVSGRWEPGVDNAAALAAPTGWPPSSGTILALVLYALPQFRYPFGSDPSRAKTLKKNYSWSLFYREGSPFMRPDPRCCAPRHMNWPGRRGKPAVGLEGAG